MMRALHRGVKSLLKANGNRKEHRPTQSERRPSRCLGRREIQS